jgi:hypothetical protein
VTYDLHAEGTNGVTGQTIVTAIDGFPIEGGISVWNVDATGASSIDALWATSTGAVGVRGRSTFNGVGVRGEVSGGTGDGVQGQGSGSFSGVAGFGGDGVADAGTGVFGLGGKIGNPFVRGGAAGVRGIGGGGDPTAPPDAVGVYGQAGKGNADGVQGHGSGYYSGVAGFGGPGQGAGLFGRGGGTHGVGVRGVGADDSEGGSFADGVTGQGSGYYSGVSGFGGKADGGGLYGQGGGKHGPGVRGIGADDSEGGSFADGVTGQGSGHYSGVSGFGGPLHGAGLYGRGGLSVPEGSGPGGPGVRGYGGPSKADGVQGFGDGVQGYGGGSRTAGVRGKAREEGGNGVIGEANVPGGWAIYGISEGFAGGYAGYFEGNVHVKGNLNVTGSVTKGGGAFQIDHPLEPESKYLVHSFVESPDMKNIYDGVAAADPSGEAIVELPAYFDALNKEFRYQLTPIGAPAPTLHVKEELVGNRFSIGGAGPGQRVCWQITGTRKDAWALANPLVVEPDKLRSKRARPQLVDGGFAHQ